MNNKKVASELVKIAKKLMAFGFDHGDRIKSTINTDAKTTDGKKVKIYKNDVFEIITSYNGGGGRTFHLKVMADKNVIIIVPEWALKAYFVPVGEY